MNAVSKVSKKLTGMKRQESIVAAHNNNLQSVYPAAKPSGSVPVKTKSRLKGYLNESLEDPLKVMLRTGASKHRLALSDEAEGYIEELR